MRYEVGKKTKAADGVPDISFNEELGLACETLPKGVSLD